MDAQGFRIAEKNGFFKPSRWQLAEQTKKELKASGSTIPADDSRYPAFAAVMSDARTFTDYRQHCQTRVPSMYERPVKQWMIRNGHDIMNLNRKRQAENTGAVLGLADTAPPAEVYFFCNPYECKKVESGNPFGTGVQTVNTPLPNLPGGFMYEPSEEVKMANTKNIVYNLVNENGRNTNKRWEMASGASHYS